MVNTGSEGPLLLVVVTGAWNTAQGSGVKGGFPAGQGKLGEQITKCAYERDGVLVQQAVWGCWGSSVHVGVISSPCSSIPPPRLRVEKALGRSPSAVAAVPSPTLLDSSFPLLLCCDCPSCHPSLFARLSALVLPLSADQYIMPCHPPFSSLIGIVGWGEGPITLGLVSLLAPPSSRQTVMGSPPRRVPR